MGTLFKQPIRDLKKVSEDELQSCIDLVKKLASKNKLSFEEVLEVIKIKEMERRNDLFVRHGDTFDEQLAGFGELLMELNGNLSQLADKK